MMEAKKWLLFGFFIVAIFCFTGCFFDSEEVLYPGSVCDTMETMNYSEEITFILSNECYSCHSDATCISYGGGQNFEGWVNVKNYLNASTYTFMASIKHVSGYSPMPKNAPQLNSCEIRQIEMWIEDGYPDN